MFLFYTLFDIILLGDTMGFFSKIKNMFKGSENTTEIEEKEESRPLSEEEKKEVKEAISTYCQMDTYAEYVVFHGLIKEVEKDA